MDIFQAIFGDVNMDGVHIAALIADIFVVLFMIYQGAIHAKKGFIKSIVDLMGFLVAVIIAVKFCAFLAGFLQDQFGLKDTLTNVFYDFLSKNDLFSVNLTKEGLVEAFASYGLPEFFVQPIVDMFEDLVAAGFETIAEAVAPILAGYAINAISAVLLFIVAYVLLKLLGAVITKIFDSVKLLGVMNRFLGFILGIMIGMFSVNALLSVLTMLPIQFIQDVLALTNVCSFLLNNNVLLLLISAIHSIVPEIPEMPAPVIPGE